VNEKLAILLNNEYASAILLAIVILIASLLFLTFYYRKKLKEQQSQLDEKDEKIKSLRQYSYEMELKRVDREHEVEKEILSLNHTIKELETKEKEGLKSHVVTMIESYEKKRTQQLKRAGISS